MTIASPKRRSPHSPTFVLRCFAVCSSTLCSFALAISSNAAFFALPTPFYLAGCSASSRVNTENVDMNASFEGFPRTTPSFSLANGADGLMLQWFDADGVHPTSQVDQVPAERRRLVRVDSIHLSPEERSEPDLVLAADLSDQANVVVRKVPRAWFENRIRAAQNTAAQQAPVVEARNNNSGAPTGIAPAAGSQRQTVEIFSAVWCGACRQAKAYLQQRNVPFIDHDIEREPGARSLMQARAQAAGIVTRGIPVIDYRGRLMEGFDPRSIDQAMRELGVPSSGSVAPGGPSSPSPATPPPALPVPPPGSRSNRRSI